MMYLITLPDPASVPPHEVQPECVRFAAFLTALATRLAVPAPAVSAHAATNLVKANDVAKALSVRVDRVYELARQGRIPSYKHGRTVRFDIEEVRQSFLRAGVN